MSDGAAGRVEIRLPVRPATLLRLLLAAVVALSVISATLRSLEVTGVDIPFEQLNHRLNVDDEGSIPTWFSTLLLFSCALLLMTVAQQLRGERFARHWWALALGFVWLSLDEVVTFHEFLNEKLNASFDDGARIVWVFPALVAVVVVGTFFVNFVRDLPRGYRVLFLSAAGAFVLGSVGLEIVGGQITDDRGGSDRIESAQNFPYVAVSTAEEFLEMTAAAVFAYGVASYSADLRARAARRRTVDLTRDLTPNDLRDDVRSAGPRPVDVR